jgi:hypothetical protein
MRPDDRRLGPYRILGEIGHGAMGVVLRAVAPSGEEVAVKILRHATPTAEPRARFDRERRVLAQLGEGFVPLLDSGETPQGPYIVMPFLRGGTLRDRLRGGPMPIADVRAMGATLARSLGRAHQAGIVHRDLKPENVLFDQGRPYVADLGLAKHADSTMAKSLSLSIAGEARGTYGYMPPEQMQDSKSADARCDVFSLGAILYECIAGEPAFRGEDLLSVLAAVSAGHVTPLADLRPETPPWLAQVVHRALDVTPARRPADGHALADALEKGERPATRSWAPWIVGALVPILGVVAWRLLPAPPAPAPPPPPRLTQRPSPPPPAPHRAGWRSCASLPEARMKLAAATGPDGAIHVLGGRGGAGTSTRHDVYDPKGDRWSSQEPLPAPRALIGATFLGPKLYVAGGSDGTNTPRGELFEWNPATGQWRTRAPMPVARQVLLLAHDGKLWAIGSTKAARDAQIYDPRDDTWSEGPVIPMRFNASTAVSLGDRIVVGGDDGVIVWTAGAPAFRELAFDRPELGLSASAGGFVAGRVYLASGRREAGPVTGVVSFDPAGVDGASVALVEEPPVAVARRSHAAAVSGGKLYVFGGLIEGEKRATESVEELSP